MLRQWEMNGNSPWKEPLLRTAVTRAPFTGKPSTPYGPGTVHDYMHAKVTVADDVVFVGSFNLSHSGEENAENVLELADAGLADGSRRSSTPSAAAIRRSRSNRGRPLPRHGHPPFG